MAYLIAPIISFVSAQLIKYALLSLSQHHAMPARQIFASGNMPSSHTATLVSLLTVMVFLLGWDSPITALAAVMTLLTGYDALYSRRSTGEIGQLVLSMLPKTKNAPRIKVALGHKPIEVFAGAILGMIIGVIVATIALS